MSSKRHDKPSEPPGLNGGSEHIWRFLNWIVEEQRADRASADKWRMFFVAMQLGLAGAIIGVKFA